MNRVDGAPLISFTYAYHAPRRVYQDGVKPEDYDPNDQHTND
jgi:hypothetical protein